MGVPRFAAWLTKKYPTMVMDRCPTDVHGLYIDLNGLIHPCCYDEHDATVALRSDLEKVRSVCLAIETLVVTVRPRHVIYIAIDGVAPRAKMNQQRARRYMNAGTPLTNTEKSVCGGGHAMSAEVVAAIEKEFTATERSDAEKALQEVSQALLGDALYGGEGGGADEATTPTDIVEHLFSVDAPTRNVTALPNSVFPFVAAAATSDDTEARFDSNCISPGTAFLEKISAAVRDFVKHKLMSAAAAAKSRNGDFLEAVGNDPTTASSPMSMKASSLPRLWADVTVVFSDSSTAGEGEHKVLDFLRTQSAFPGFNGGGCHVIAGLDADLIFLSLSLHIPRMVILRDHNRSNYDEALLPISMGGTLVPTKKAAKTGAGGVSESDSTSSIASAAAMSASATTTTAAEVAETPVGSPNLRREEAEEGEDAIDDNTAMHSTDGWVDGEKPSSEASPSLASPPASPVSLPHIANIAADVCTTYEYYDIDVVGASLVSEVYQLCLEKGMKVRGDPLEKEANCTASNGFRFYHSGGGNRTAAATERNKSAGEKTSSSSKSPHASTSSTRVLPSSTSSFHPCTSTSNSKIIDDFIVLGMLLGNDFLPHLPSVYCGESAMDTLLDVYTSAVLPYGYLTGGLYEIQLLQLERFLRAYAAVEAARFRQHAIQTSLMTPQEAATAELCSAADRRCWYDTYIRTTSLENEAGVQAACRAYVEGLRFVWRYYSSTSLEVSWSWYYPFHHAPFALDVANFLRAQGPNIQTTLTAPKLERLPPSPLCQLLCILPPTSRRLVPAALRASMVAPPPELVDTFPTTWKVDFTGAYGKDHLAAVLLPFANLPDLQTLVSAHAESFTADELARNVLRSTHLVLQFRSDEDTEAATRGEKDQETETKGNKIGRGKPERGATPAITTGGFHIHGNGLEPLAATDVPAEFQGCTPIQCSSLVDIVPPLSRPRTYSYTVPIPNITVLPDGTRVPAERRPQYRHGNRGRRGNKDGKNNKEHTHGAASSSSAAAATNTAHTTKPVMLFGEFLIVVAFVGLLTAATTACRSTNLLGALQLLLQLHGIAITVLGVAFALGLAVASKGRTPGSGLHRHNIFTAFADWQCASCLSLNFSRNRRCFICRAPFDPSRCVALFSSRNPPEPPLMDADHGAYTASYGIISL